MEGSKATLENLTKRHNEISNQLTTARAQLSLAETTLSVTTDKKKADELKANIKVLSDKIINLVKDFEDVSRLIDQANKPIETGKKKTPPPKPKTEPSPPPPVTPTEPPKEAEKEEEAEEETEDKDFETFKLCLESNDILDFDLGINRLGKFDASMVIKNCFIRMKSSSLTREWDPSTQATFLKFVGVKLAIHGLRIGADNKFEYEDRAWTMLEVFRDVFITTQKLVDTVNQTQDAITPSRLSRIFADAAVEYLVKNESIKPPLMEQETMKIETLPRRLYFLAACWSKEAKTYEKEFLILGARFDMTLYHANQGSIVYNKVNSKFNVENGFFVRMWVVFHQLNNLEKVKRAYKSLFLKQDKISQFSLEVLEQISVELGWEAAFEDFKKGKEKKAKEEEEESTE